MQKLDFNRWLGGLPQWVHGTEQRLAKAESVLSHVASSGLGEQDPRSAQVLEGGFKQLENEIGAIRREQQHFLQKYQASEAATQRAHADLDLLNRRIQDLSYQVGVYDEVVQGIAVRPETAVPAIVRDKKTGGAYLNPIKVHTKTFWLASNPRVVTVPAGGQNRIVFTVPAESNLEGDFEIYYLELARATSLSLRCRLGHTGLGGQFLSNQPVHVLSTFGNMLAGPQPFQMYETIFLEPGLELVVDLFDFSGADNDVELIVHGRRFIGYSTAGMDRRGLIDVFARGTWPYWQTTDNLVALTAGVGVATVANMTLERQFHAELMKAMQFGSIAGIQVPVPFHLRINEGQSSTVIADAVPGVTWGGNGNFPIALAEPYLQIRGTPLLCTFTNDNGLAGQIVDIVVHGRALPIGLPNQRTLEPALLDANRDIQLPPSQKDLTIPRLVSM